MLTRKFNFGAKTASAIVTSRAGGKNDGLAALLAIIIAFTIQLTVAIIERPRPR